MTTKRTTTTKPTQMKATLTDAHDFCKDCRTAEALANDPTLAPPPGSFLHYLVTLPRPLSRCEGRDQIEELSALARTDKDLHQYCADFGDWGPIAVQRFFVWCVIVPIGTLQGFHLAVAAWLDTVESVELGYLRGRLHGILTQLVRAHAIDPTGKKPMARTLGRQVAVGLTWAETAIHALDTEDLDALCDLVEVIHTIRYAIDNGPESYAVHKADIQKALKATAPKQARRA